MLSDQQIAFFDTFGYLVLPGLFSAKEMEVIDREFKDVMAEDRAGQEFFEGLTKLLCTTDKDKSIWTKGEVQKSFECKCKLMRDKWQTLKVRWHQFKQFKDDEEEDRKPVVVENDETPKKRSKFFVS